MISIESKVEGALKAKRGWKGRCIRIVQEKKKRKYEILWENGTVEVLERTKIRLLETQTSGSAFETPLHNHLEDRNEPSCMPGRESNTVEGTSEASNEEFVDLNDDSAR